MPILPFPLMTTLLTWPCLLCCPDARVVGVATDKTRTVFPAPAQAVASVSRRGVGNDGVAAALRMVGALIQVLALSDELQVLA